jgi:hypothetical protein
VRREQADAVVRHHNGSRVLELVNPRGAKMYS